MGNSYAYVHDYGSAKKYLEGGKSGRRRPLSANVDVVETHRGYGIRLHHTVIVEYLSDGLQVLNSGGWRTVTTLRKIKEFSRANLSGWNIHHSSDGKTPPKVQKCRQCSGMGFNHHTCDGVRLKYGYKENENGEKVWTNWTESPCYHDLSEPHEWDTDCWYCENGRRDYGSKPIPTPFEDGVVVNATGLVVGHMPPPVTSAPMKQQKMLGKLKKSGYYGSGHLYSHPIAAMKPVANNGDKVLDNLYDLLPNLKDVIRHPCQHGELGTVANVVIHLNDQDKWSREQIADWLETLDCDLRFPTPKSDSGT